MKTLPFFLIVAALTGCCSYGKPLRDWSANEYAMCGATWLAAGYIATRKSLPDATTGAGDRSCESAVYDTDFECVRR